MNCTLPLQSKEEEQQAASADAVFPVILQIMENCIFNAKDPIVLGCSIEEGIAKVSHTRCSTIQSCLRVATFTAITESHNGIELALIPSRK